METRYHKRRCNRFSRVASLLCICMHAGYTLAQVSAEMTAGLTTQVTGGITMEINGNWINQGFMTPGMSTLILNGSGDQSLRQEGGAFYHLTVTKSGGEVVLAGNISIQGGSLVINGQDVALNGHLLILDASSLLDETSGNTVKGTAGYVTTTRHIAAPSTSNIAGMGYTISSAGNFGLTEIRRGHAAQTANSAAGILRYFDIIPEFNAAESSVQFLYDESELNGNTEAGLKLYRSPDGGINWVEVEGTLNSAENVFSAEGVNISARYTLSSYCLETCIATIANVQPADLYLNAAGLSLLLPGDVDNGSKGACGVDSMVVSPEVFDCDDLGMQAVAFTVVDNNGCSKSVTTTIEVIDAIAPVVLCRDLTVQLDELCQGSILPADIDYGSFDACGLSLSIDTWSFNCEDVGNNAVVLTAVDGSGNTAQCTSTVTVEFFDFPDVLCQEIYLDIGNEDHIMLNALQLIVGDADDYEGYSFSVDPEFLYCDQLGEHLVTVTAIDPVGNTTMCEVGVYLDGPDTDCDQVADQCDVCNGGDDQQDADEDGIPDCADWDGWADLPAEWQCAGNKVFICHEGNVLCVNQSAVAAHLEHGDFLGPCSASSCAEEFLLDTDKNPERMYNQPLQVLDDDPESTRSERVTVALEAYNIPNPFSAHTIIRYQLPIDAEVWVTIYDMVGRIVQVYHEEMMHAGWHEVEFDGSGYADGVYYYQIRTPDMTLMQPMVLAK